MLNARRHRRGEQARALPRALSLRRCSTPEGIGAANRAPHASLLNHCSNYDVFKDRVQCDECRMRAFLGMKILHGFRMVGTVKHQGALLAAGFLGSFGSLSSDLGSALRTPVGA